MTLVVADSSPLHYLILLGRPDLLRHLFDSVVIPPAVAEELAQPNTPPRVREWIQNPPPWLSVDDRPLGPRSPVLDPGEADAISLALALGADAILIDENRGRNEARRLGLRPLGVVGVLEQAASQNLVDLRAVLQQLVSTTNFRITQRVLDEVLDRDQSRRPRNPGLEP